MEEKKNMLDEDIEIIDDLENNQSKKEDFQVNHPDPNLDEWVMDDYMTNSTYTDEDIVDQKDDQPQPGLNTGINSNFSGALKSEVDSVASNNPNSNTNETVQSVKRNDDEKAMEVLNTAEIIDPKITVPQETGDTEILTITREQNKEVDNKKGIIFITILFSLLILFIIALPQITKLVQQAAG